MTQRNSAYIQHLSNTCENMGLTLYKDMESSLKKCLFSVWSSSASSHRSLYHY